MIKSRTTLMITAAAIMTITMLFSSCMPEDEVKEPDTQVNISNEVLEQFKSLGFDVSDIDVVPASNPLTGEFGSKNYVLEGDIVITPDNLREMLKSDLHHEGPCGEQYRTYNLVGGLPRTIDVIGYTGWGNALDPTMQTALSLAIDNYNQLNTNLNFTLTFGTNYSSYDIVVYAAGSGAGGSAGFPSGGDPYQFVEILGGTSAYGVDVTEHVMTHEIGHCLGLRHTDYFNRSLSCGTGGNEGSAGVGAVHIPGTPTGFDPNSIMLSCFTASEDGEFGNYDVVALETLY